MKIVLTKKLAKVTIVSILANQILAKGTFSAKLNDMFQFVAENMSQNLKRYYKIQLITHYLPHKNRKKIF
jgi:hypothetical protein